MEDELRCSAGRRAGGLWCKSRGQKPCPLLNLPEQSMKTHNHRVVWVEVLDVSHGTCSGGLGIYDQFFRSNTERYCQFSQNLLKFCEGFQSIYLCSCLIKMPDSFGATRSVWPLVSFHSFPKCIQQPKELIKGFCLLFVVVCVCVKVVTLNTPAILCLQGVCLVRLLFPSPI